MRDEIEKIRAHISELESERDWLRERLKSTQGGIVMKWFSKHSVCKTCGVHFEPPYGRGNYSDPIWVDFCEVHRKPMRERALVMAWAERNWERLKIQIDEEGKNQ